MPSRKRKRKTILINSQLFERAKRMAGELGISLYFLIEQTLEHQLPKYEQVAIQRKHLLIHGPKAESVAQ